MTVFGRKTTGGSSSSPSSTYCATSNANQIDFGGNCASSWGATRGSTNLLTLSENDSWLVHSNTYTGTLISSYKGDGFTVKATTGYLWWHEYYNKGDGLPVTEQHYLLDQKTWQISQDVVVSSTGQHFIDWMAGAYASSGNVNNPTYSYTPINGYNLFNTNNTYTQTLQGFAQLDTHITPKLTLGTGARFIYEHDHKAGGTFKYSADWSTYMATQAYLDQSIQQNAISWKANLDYKPDANTLVYGSVTEGFKSGGFAASPNATSSAQLNPYKGEHIYAFEVGSKASLAHHKVDLEGALFYYVYHNMQTNQQQLVGNLNVNVFGNLPKAHLKGLEVSATFRPISGLELKLDGGWVDTWVGAFTSGGVLYKAGNRFANAPSFAGTVSGRYQWHLTDAVDLALGASAHRQSSVYANTENTAIYRVNTAATLVNAQFQVLLPHKGWSMMFWGKNLTNCEYTNSTYQNSSTVNTLYNMPRTYGVSLTKNF